MSLHFSLQASVKKIYAPLTHRASLVPGDKPDGGHALLRRDPGVHEGGGQGYKPLFSLAHSLLLYWQL